MIDLSPRPSFRTALFMALALLAAGCTSPPAVQAPTTTESPSVHTSESTTPVPMTTTSTTTSTDPPDQALQVTARPIELPQEVLTAAEGMILGVGEDDAQSLRDIMVRVEDGRALAVRGRRCGTFFGPSPLDDLAGGGVVSTDEGFVIACTPGEEVANLSIEGIPTDTFSIEGRPMLAAATHTEGRGLVVLVDLETHEQRVLLTTDGTVESPIAASRSRSGLWVVTLITQNESGIVRYVFIDDEGQVLQMAGNPHPEFSEADTGLRVAALSPDGTLLALGEDGEGRNAGVVLWDLETGQEIARHTLMNPFPGETIASIDVSDSRLIVNTEIANEEIHPFRLAIIDLQSRGQTIIHGHFDGLEFRHATFLEP